MATGTQVDLVIEQKSGESLRGSIKRRAQEDYKIGKEILIPLELKDLSGKYNSIGKTAAQYGKALEQAIKVILEKYSYSLCNADKARLFDIRDSLVESSTTLTNLMQPDNKITGFNPEHGAEISNTDFSGDKLTSLQAHLIVELVKLGNECDGLNFQIPVG